MPRSAVATTGSRHFCSCKFEPVTRARRNEVGVHVHAPPLSRSGFAAANLACGRVDSEASRGHAVSETQGLRGRAANRGDRLQLQPRQLARAGRLSGSTGPTTTGRWVFGSCRTPKSQQQFLQLQNLTCTDAGSCRLSGRRLPRLMGQSGFAAAKTDLAGAAGGVAGSCPLKRTEICSCKSLLPLPRDSGVPRAGQQANLQLQKCVAPGAGSRTPEGTPLGGRHRLRAARATERAASRQGIPEMRV